MNITFFQIKLFLLTAETKNFSRTAEIMHMEQSTLSRRIAVLEQELGFLLFKRDSRPVQLTEEGQMLYEQWKPLLGTFEDSISHVYAQRKRKRAVLSICMIDSGNQVSSVPALSMMAQEALPDITLSFQFAPVEQLVPKLLEGQADLVITSEALTKRLDGRFTIWQIMQVPLLACMLKTNPLSKKESIAWNDLSNQRFITISAPHIPYHAELTQTVCEKHGFTPAFGSESQNAHGLTSALQHNDEVLICDRFLRGTDSPMFKHFELPGESSALCAISTVENKSPYIKPFFDLLCKFFAE